MLDNRECSIDEPKYVHSIARFVAYERSAAHTCIDAPNHTELCLIISVKYPVQPLLHISPNDPTKTYVMYLLIM